MSDGSSGDAIMKAVGFLVGLSILMALLDAMMRGGG